MWLCEGEEGPLALPLPRAPSLSHLGRRVLPLRGKSRRRDGGAKARRRLFYPQIPQISADYGVVSCRCAASRAAGREARRREEDVVIHRFRRLTQIMASCHAVGGGGAKETSPWLRLGLAKRAAVGFVLGWAWCFGPGRYISAVSRWFVRWLRGNNRRGQLLTW